MTKNNGIDKYSPKSGVVFGLLGFFLGFTGAHNFYLGKNVKGTFQLIISLFLLFCIFEYFWGSTNGVGFYFLLMSLVYTVGLILIFPFVLFWWIGLNLILTKTDGKGRLMERRGLPVFLGSLICLSVFIIMLVMAPFLTDPNLIVIIILAKIFST